MGKIKHKWIEITNIQQSWMMFGEKGMYKLWRKLQAGISCTKK